MSRAREWALIVCVALAALAAGYAYNVWRTEPDPGDAGLKALMAARLPDLEGKPQPFDQWSEKVVVVNFWATWCAPCREEIPIFVKLQDKYRDRGLQFVGIAIDQPEKVRAFAAELGMNFPVLIGGANAIDLTRLLGNRASVLPYTLIIDRTGKAVHKQVGAVKETDMEARLKKLL